MDRANRSHVFYRSGGSAPSSVVGGEGVYLIDDAGRRYLDASGGAAVSCLGHDHPGVLRAIKDQLDRVPYAHTSFFTSPAAEALATELCTDAPDGIDRAYFVTGGSEAMEAAVKLARQYYVERGEDRRRQFVARRQSYHGNTLGALAIGGNEWRRAPFAPLLTSASHVSPCYAYRGTAEGESEAAYGARLAEELEEKLRELGPETVIAFVAETVVGATLGAVPPAPGYFARVREICDRHGILLILDEVMCGMGRTGTRYACEQESVRPDIIAVAKGLGAGYQPIGAMLASAEIHDTIASGSGFFQHGHTYMGHATACAGALAVQQAIREEDLLANVRRQGERLGDALRERLGGHPHVGDVRGRGLFWGIELVRDRETKEPFDPSLGLHRVVKKQAMAAGLLCYPMGGCIDGRRGDHVLLAPPYILSDAEADVIVERMASALAGGLREIRA